MITFECPECHKGLSTGDGNMGKRIRCPGCRKDISVPDPTARISRFDCPECGSPIEKLTRELGTRMQCPSCSQSILAPTADELRNGTTLLSSTRCAICGMQAKPEFRCTGCAARFCSEDCRKRHLKATPHGCAAMGLFVLLVIFSLVSATVTVLVSVL